MSKMKDLVDNLTDEQILSSAYMCCQRNAVKAEYINIKNINEESKEFCSRDGMTAFKADLRSNYAKIGVNTWVKIMLVVLIIGAIVFSFIKMAVDYDIISFNPLIEKAFYTIWFVTLFFPIIRKIFIEHRIAKLYKAQSDIHHKNSLICLPKEQNLSEQLTAMDEYLSQNSVIPQKYWDYALNIVNYIYMDLRATNLREAINILEEDLHRSRLENKMLEIERLAKDNANAINDMMRRIDNIECFQEYLSQRQRNLEWDVLIAKSRS